MTSKSAHVSLWTKEFIGITISNLFLFLSFQMLIPTLPVYVEENGGDELAIGLVIGIFTISALLTRPFAGKGLDTIGRRKILTIGMIIFVLSVAGYYWFATVFLILAVRFIHGIGWGMATTTLGTMISDIIPAERRGEGMGYYGLSSTLAMALAPMVGIWVMNEFGFGVLFLIATIFGLLSIIIFLWVPYQEPPIKNEQVVKSSFWEGLVDQKALFPSLLVLLLGVTYGGIVSFITLFGADVGIKNVGWFFLFNALMVMIVRPVAGKLFDRRGHKWVLYPGAFFTITGLILLSYTTTVGTLIAASVFYGIGFGAIQPSLQAWTINRVSPQRRGVANGTFFSGFDLGIGVGAMLLGIVARYTSYAMMYRISVVLMVIYLLVYSYHLIQGKNRESNQKAS
ncbi:MFS transporter [Ammoniphilus resinae]|uniref:MFS family permease n=1 Tax=Ammoniphilus resinae TaxID=861532 RepID=A0ABS4GLE9_9BACL|nr:MFS transporter [Ammoniphilus resinae]MBP1931074.1 MFS family permease [Ammoniphilus resinae]